MERPKISVIVPVYNVEPYLRKCLDSIVRQTYQNLEIILVDDGSPDSCGAICDEYAAQDDRIRVIHQANGGVSAARNAGLAAATGEWIGWVDSDDWIEPDMFELMLLNSLESNADIAVCSRFEEYPNRSVFRGWDETKLLNTEDALYFLLQNDQMQNFLWDKLFRRDLFNGLWFWEGKTYEDIALMHCLFERAERVICYPEGSYHYFQRENSIVSNIALGNRINHYFAAQKRYFEMQERWSQFRDLLEAQCVASSVGIWCAYYANPKDQRRQAAAQLREIAEFAAARGGLLQCCKGLGLAGRLVVRLIPHDTWWSFALARCVSRAYRVKHGRYL